jgi:hypothetical protein
MKAFLNRKMMYLVLVGLLFVSLNVNAQKEKLQTAFIYQLTRLVEWCPEGKEGNFVIGVVGNEPALMAELAALSIRRVGTQQIEIKTYASVADVVVSNIIIVPDSQFDNIKDISAKVANSCTLIISERAGGANRGAGVSIVYNDKVSKLELEINKNYMRRNSLNVNDQLYSIATTIY